MVTAVISQPKILVYDGDCPLCLQSVDLLRRSGLVRPDQLRSNHDLRDADLDAVWAAGIRNQMVALDIETRQTRVGIDALLWVIGQNTRYPGLVRALSWPGIRHVLRFGYQAVSYNRRILSPPQRRVMCDCEPEATLARRLQLVVPLLVLTALMLIAAGAALVHGWEPMGVTPTAGGWSAGSLAAAKLLIAWGAAMTVLGAAAGIVLRAEQRVDYLAHLSVTMFVGAAVLLANSVVSLALPETAAVWVNKLAAVLSVACMLAMQRRRVRAIELSAGWVAAWVVAMVLSAGAALSFQGGIF